MKRVWLLFVALLACVPFGAVAAVRAVQSQDAPNYLVISVYRPAPGTSFNEGKAQMSEYVRIHRATGNYKSVRLFGHRWGREQAFYLVSEPNDWASIPTGFAAVLEAHPDLPAQPSLWQARSDDILAEIVVN